MKFKRCDFGAQSIKYREDTFNLRHVLFTHVHNDHFDNRLLWFRAVVKAQEKPEGKIHLYFTRVGIEIIKDILPKRTMNIDRDYRWLDGHLKTIGYSYKITV